MQSAHNGGCFLILTLLCKYVYNINYKGNFEMQEEEIKLVESKMQILEMLFDAVNNNSVDVGVDLSSFSSEELGEMYNDIMAFNIIANNDAITDYFTYDQMSDFINGEFRLKNFTSLEAMEKIKKFPRHMQLSMEFEGLEYSIQDGKFYVVKERDVKRLVNYYEKLKTNAPMLCFNDEDMTRKKLPYEVLNIFRNMLAHGSKLEKDCDNGLLVVSQDYKKFSCTPMWLRGLSSIWSARHKTLDYEGIKNLICKEYGVGKKSISSPDDIKEILKITDSKTDYRKDPSHMYKFVLNRLKYYDNYYGMVDEKGNEDFDKKIDIFINSIANNPNHIVGGYEVLNSKILYNIQQIVAMEQEKCLRKKYGKAISDNVNINKATSELQDARKLMEELEKVDEKLLEFKTQLDSKVGKVKELYYYKNKKTIETLIAKRKKINLQCKASLDEVSNDFKIESDEMKLFDKNTIANMPVEVAVNLVGLMGYNRLVSTKFYETLLSLDPKTFTKAQRKIINNLDLSAFSFTTKRGKLAVDDLENKITLLKRIRHATTHGNISYSIPPSSSGELTYKDVKMVYSCDGDSEIKVSGRVEDFYNLFKNPVFRPNPKLTQTNIKDGGAR